MANEADPPSVPPDESVSDFSSTPSSSGVEEPPTTLFGTLRRLGPGLIIAGSIVGSGELIATTKTGAQAGMTLLWLILIGCVIKVFVQIELGRYTISSGDTCLAGLNRVPGPRWRANWIVWYWLVLTLVSLAQLGGIVGGVGMSFALSMPLTGDFQSLMRHRDPKTLRAYYDFRTVEEHLAECSGRCHEILEGLEAEDEVEQAGLRGEAGPLHPDLNALRAYHDDKDAVFEAVDQHLSTCSGWCRDALETLRGGRKIVEPYTWDDKLWCIIIAAPTIVMLVRGRYGLVQAVATGLVAAFTFLTLGNVLSLQFTSDWNIRGDELIRGLAFAFPEGEGLPMALSTFGIIGVGATELIQYPYWCLEKGYAQFTGPKENTEGWVRRARGWMMVMHYDAWLSMCVYTFATIAFYILGACVLHRLPAGTGDPEGMRMVSTLAEAYVPIFGAYAKWLFLLGAIAVLYSTFFVANAGLARVAGDGVAVFGLISPHDGIARNRAIGFFCIVCPLISVAVHFVFPDPPQLVKIAGIMQSIMLPMLGGAALWFRYRRADRRLDPGRLWDSLLWISCVGLLIAGASAAYFGIGDLFGGGAGGH